MSGATPPRKRFKRGETGVFCKGTTPARIGLAVVTPECQTGPIFADLFKELQKGSVDKDSDFQKTNNVNKDSNDEVYLSEQIWLEQYKSIADHAITLPPYSDEISLNLIQAMKWRFESLRDSGQRIPEYASLFRKTYLTKNCDDEEFQRNCQWDFSHAEKDKSLFDTACQWIFEEGVIKPSQQVLDKLTDKQVSFYNRYRDIKIYVGKLTWLQRLRTDPRVIEFCKKRNEKITREFEEYKREEEAKQMEIKAITPRPADLKDVFKIDCHLHASACLARMDLFKFVRNYVEHNPDTVLDKFDEATGEWLTLKSYLATLGVTASNMSLDTFGSKASSSMFGKFKEFRKAKYLFGDKLVSKAFLKLNNRDEGKAFSSMIQRKTELMDKKCKIEPRITFTGKSKMEWNNISSSFVKNVLKLRHADVHYLGQIPERFCELKSEGVNSFNEMLHNIFFIPTEALLNSANSSTAVLFKELYGWDIVDEERTNDFQEFLAEWKISPSDWTENKNPTKLYYIFYCFTNLLMINGIRRSLGICPLSFRPHIAEVKNPHHLDAAFITSESIAHGTYLDNNENDVIKYLMYIAQVPISCSPRSNHALTRRCSEQILPSLFAQGLNVSLSSDDPAIFSECGEDSLLKELEFAKSIWGFTDLDLKEMARRSIRTSSFNSQSHEMLGDPSIPYREDSNYPPKTGITNERFNYRMRQLRDEHDFLLNLTSPTL